MTSRKSTSFFVVSLLALVVSLAVAAWLLPERVPIHFDAAGDVDRWAGRGEALLTMGLVGAAIAAVFGGLAARLGRVPLALVNVPHKQWWTATPEREAVLRARLRTDLFVLGGATLLFLAALELLTVRAARLDEPHLDGWVWVALAAYLAVVGAATAYALTVRYRKESA